MSLESAPEAGPQPTDPAPQTGVSEIDAAMSGLGDLDDATIAEHHDRLARAHAILHEALNADNPPSERQQP